MIYNKSDLSNKVDLVEHYLLNFSISVDVDFS